MSLDINWLAIVVAFANFMPVAMAILTIASSRKPNVPRSVGVGFVIGAG